MSDTSASSCSVDGKQERDGDKKRSRHHHTKHEKKRKRKEKHKGDRHHERRKKKRKHEEKSWMRRCAMAKNMFEMMLALFPDARKDLDNLLLMLDKGETAIITDVANVQMKELLMEAFAALKLDEVRVGHYRKRNTDTRSFQHEFNWLMQDRNLASSPVPSKAKDYHNEEEDDDDESYGPQPAGSNNARRPRWEDVVNLRKQEMELLDNAPKPRRAAWMTEAPQQKLGFEFAQLETRSRGFQTSSNVDASSSNWSTGKGEHVFKVDESIVPKQNEKADTELRSAMEQFNATHRASSLMQDVEKASAHNTEGASQKSTVPIIWNRERDLLGGVQIDEKRTKTIVAKASDLNSKFSNPKYSRQFL